MATATTLNLLPFRRMAKDVYNAYNSPSMAADIIGGIPIHRVDNFFTKHKRQRMIEEALDVQKAIQPLIDENNEVEKLIHIK